ncbi:MAG TPA: thiamine phosphate synthase [Rhodocyclaceae bacterium]|jgi:thiamine-phosphate pyrophosphorylase|nr:thiamine phosphate synthase [Rhodocyclaceae bacterium]
MSLNATQQASLRGLYAVTPDDYLVPRLSALVREALAGGVKVVQYRNKTAPPPLFRAQAAELLRICRAAGALLIVNDNPEIAADIGADGVHVGREDGGVAKARAIVGPDRIIGVSCYADINLAALAVAEGADYVAFGAMFPSIVKPGAAPAPLSVLTEAKQRFAVPVCAIGGINLANTPSLIDAGVDMAAVITDLFDAPDIAAQARSYQNMFGVSA